MPTHLFAWLEIARSLLEQPTAAVKEILPQKVVRDFVDARPNLSLSEDAAGNLRVDYKGSQSKRAPLVMVAHLDHPGFHISAIDADSVELSFQGSVNGRHAIPGSRIQFFELGNAAPIGEGTLIERTDETGALKTARAKIDSGRAALDGFAMWAFPGFSVQDDVIVTRCCDDLLGAAAALCVLDEISKLAPEDVAVTGFFTRAEELGFLHAGSHPARNAAEECLHSVVGMFQSLRQRTAGPRGHCAGRRCVKHLRHGLDARPYLSAKKRAESDPSFKFQRKLMDGGTCEATPFCAHGYRASGLALPLGNYHNQALDAENNPCMGPESVHIDDYRCEIELLVELSLHPELLDEQHDKVTPRLKALAVTAQELLS